MPCSILFATTYACMGGIEEWVSSQQTVKPQKSHLAVLLMSQTLSWKYFSVRRARMRSMEYMSSGSSVSASSVPKACNICAISFTVSAKFSIAWWETIIDIRLGFRTLLQLIKSALKGWDLQESAASDSSRGGWEAHWWWSCCVLTVAIKTWPAGF